jgi:GNAT superfamily N-acetyltransferase
MLPVEVAKARAMESSRPLRERVVDEATTEPLASTFEEWLASPKELDLPGVDVKSPLKFDKEEHFSAGRREVDGRMSATDSDGQLVGSLRYTWSPCNLNIDSVEVHPAFRGRGYAAFIMREFINMQDKLCIPASLQVAPYDVDDKPGLEREALEKLYTSFGFIPTRAENMMKRLPECRTKRERDRLMRECEDARRDWERLESRLDFPVPKVKPGQMVEVYYPVTGNVFKAKAVSEPVEKGEDIWRVKIIDKAGDPAYAVWSNKGGGFIYGDIER